MFTLRKKMQSNNIVKKRYPLWNFQDLLNILNENEVAGSTAVVETCDDRFEKLLFFSLLFFIFLATLSLDMKNNSFITRTFRKDRAYMRYVKILIFLSKTSKSVSKV